MQRIFTLSESRISERLRLCGIRRQESRFIRQLYGSAAEQHDMIEKMEKDGMSELVRKKTGLIPDAYFSGTKLKWILDHVEGARERAKNGELLFGTVDTWLIWKLTKGKVHVDRIITNASRTMLFDTMRENGIKRFWEYLDIPECMLPEVKPSSCIYGYTNENLIGGESQLPGRQETSRQLFSDSVALSQVM